MAKRICIVRHHTYDLLVRREAETLRDAGFDVDVICVGARDKGNALTINGVRTYHVPIQRKKGGLIRYLFEYASFFLAAAWTLTSLHLRRPFACIQVNNMPDFLVFATLIPRLLGSKVTMVMYEPTPELWATKYNDLRLVKLLELVERLSLRYAHAIFAVTEPMKQVFVRRGCPARKINVILNAPETRFFERSVPVEKDLAHFTCVCHGAIEERYGHDTMLNAIARVRSQIPGLQLRILGWGSYLDEFLAQVTELGLEEHVQYLGFVPLAQMVTELERADVGIVAQKSSPYSNLVHTGKMYDYFTFGLPVLTSRLKAVEAYFDADSVCFFEAGDAESLGNGILDLYQNPEKRRRLVENSQRLYDQYKWAEQREIYLSVYREIGL